MTDNNPPAPPEESKPAAKPARKAAPKVGDVVQTSPGRYSIVVGTEKVRHAHQDANGAPTDSVTREHPLVIDLGTARRHEIDLHED